MAEDQFSLLLQRDAAGQALAGLWIQSCCAGSWQSGGLPFNVSSRTSLHFWCRMESLGKRRCRVSRSAWFCTGSSKVFEGVSKEADGPTEWGGTRANWVGERVGTIAQAAVRDFVKFRGSLQRVWCQPCPARRCAKPDRLCGHEASPRRGFSSYRRAAAEARKSGREQSHCAYRRKARHP